MSDQAPSIEPKYPIKTPEQPPHQTRTRRWTLEELLQGVPEGAIMPEIDWGPREALSIGSSFLVEKCLKREICRNVRRSQACGYCLSIPS
jgi:hypothetical protein